MSGAEVAARLYHAYVNAQYRVVRDVWWFDLGDVQLLCAPQPHAVYELCGKYRRHEETNQPNEVSP